MRYFSQTPTASTSVVRRPVCRGGMFRRLLISLLALVASMLPMAVLGQGLVAYPFASCPEVKGEPRCVWVTDAIQFVTRSSERVEGNFRLEVLNPGATDADVLVVLRDRSSGAFITEVTATIPPGKLQRILGITIDPSDRVTGTVLISSKAPLLLWAYKFEDHYPNRGSTNAAPRASARQHIDVIPINCDEKLLSYQNFEWLCKAAEGPEPPI
jgi:hypothetical protein